VAFLKPHFDEELENVLPSYDQTWEGEKPGVWATSRPRRVACSAYATVSSSPEEVEKATLSWARDLGWRPQPPFLAFTMHNQWPWIYQFGDLEVHTLAEDDHVVVMFTASFDYWWPGQAFELQRIADAFADGVCTDLRSQGATVGPSDMGRSRQNRKLVMRIEQWRARLYQPLTLLVVPVYGALLLVTGMSGLTFVFFGAFGWVCTVLMGSMHIRYRILGARMRLFLFLVVMLLLFTAGMTVAAFFDSG
jgi:hypothetical protein